MILINGNIRTMVEGNPKAEAIAIAGDRIIFVGESNDVKQFRSTNTRILDLQGKTVLPGLIDAHAHFLSLGKKLQKLDLGGTTSKEEIHRMVLKECQRVGPDRWIYGRGWDHNDWDTKTFPTWQDLQGTESNPIYLSRVAGHSYWVNKKALELAGTTRETPDPEGGRIVRNENGEPTGVLIDNAQCIIDAIVPDPTHEELVERAMLAQQECLRFGLTGVGEAGIDSAEIEVYKHLCREEKLKIRIYAMYDADEVDIEKYYQTGPQIGLFNNHFTLRTIKLYADGALGSRGAALLEPYSDDPGNRGLVVTDSDSMYEICREALSRGFQVCTHAIGDHANRLVLDAYERALKENTKDNHRFRIEHAQIVSLNDIPRFATLGIIPSMQPAHATSDMYWAEDRVGSERIKGAYAWRSFLDTGVRIPFGSDFPVESPNPLWGIYAAVTRQDHQGWPKGGWYPEQKLSVYEAVKGFTLDAAYGAFEEDIKGSLEVGKLADLVVLSKDIFEVPAGEILNTEVLMTVVGGEVVYEADK
ncbi:MAG: amidohydrolase [Gemmatimonadota bacterium]|nr:MAG: amidohydrolase [Gemmatimonadota bacterium]